MRQGVIPARASRAAARQILVKSARLAPRAAASCSHSGPTNASGRRRDLIRSSGPLRVPPPADLASSGGGGGRSVRARSPAPIFDPIPDVLTSIMRRRRSIVSGSQIFGRGSCVSRRGTPVKRTEGCPVPDRPLRHSRDGGNPALTQYRIRLSREGLEAPSCPGRTCRSARARRRIDRASRRTGPPASRPRRRPSGHIWRSCRFRSAWRAG